MMNKASYAPQPLPIPIFFPSFFLFFLRLNPNWNDYWNRGICFSNESETVGFGGTKLKKKKKKKQQQPCILSGLRHQKKIITTVLTVYMET